MRNSLFSKAICSYWFNIHGTWWCSGLEFFVVLLFTMVLIYLNILPIMIPQVTSLIFLFRGRFFPPWDPLWKLYFVWLHICLHQQLAILDFSLCKVFKNAKWFSSLPILTSFRSGYRWTCVKYGDECRDVRHVRFKLESALTRHDDWCYMLQWLWEIIEGCWIHAFWAPKFQVGSSSQESLILRRKCVMCLFPLFL